MIRKKDYSDCLKYISSYWRSITFSFPKDRRIHVGLPNPFVAPNADIYKNDQFYWDTYFTNLGLLASSKTKLAKGMVDNLAHLYRRFRVMPMRNRWYNLGISQPPFFTSMILDIYEKTKDKRWLKKMALIAEDELFHYWGGDRAAAIHMIYRGLFRYVDHFITHATAEHESGWDMTSRFNNHCLDYLPVDLNCLLHRYMTDLADIHVILGDARKAKQFTEKAENMKKEINRLLWNENQGFFFDYDYTRQKQSTFLSLAGFYPLWTKLASKEQAEQMVKRIRLFERKGGLANTTRKGVSKEPKQWDFPNGWPNQQWIVIRGLLNYGYRDDAERLAKKWLDMNRKIFKRTGKFWEKYDVVNANLGKSGRYTSQEGFAWTNAVFVKLVEEFSQ